MFKIVEISKGMKPAGLVFKLGGTPEYDFYVDSTKTIDDEERLYYSARHNNANRFIHDFQKVISRKGFEFSKQLNDYREKIELEPLKI